jgi:hypothetical protein
LGLEDGGHRVQSLRFKVQSGAEGVKKDIFGKN